VRGTLRGVRTHVRVRHNAVSGKIKNHALDWQAQVSKIPTEIALRSRRRAPIAEIPAVFVCVRLCVCSFVCVYVCMYVGTNACMYVSIYTCTM